MPRVGENSPSKVTLKVLPVQDIQRTSSRPDVRLLNYQVAPRVSGAMSVTAVMAMGLRFFIVDKA